MKNNMIIVGLLTVLALAIFSFMFYVFNRNRLINERFEGDMFI